MLTFVFLKISHLIMHCSFLPFFVDGRSIPCFAFHLIAHANFESFPWIVFCIECERMIAIENKRSFVKISRAWITKAKSAPWTVSWLKILKIFFRFRSSLFTPVLIKVIVKQGLIHLFVHLSTCKWKFLKAYYASVNSTIPPPAGQPRHICSGSLSRGRGISSFPWGEPPGI